MAIIRKKSLDISSQKENPCNIRRNSQVLYLNSPKNRFGSPVNLRKITRNPPTFAFNTNPTRNPVFSKAIESDIQTPVRTPSNQTVISFTDISMYKTNLIDFFREEEAKEIPKKLETNNIKGIIKNNSKKANEFVKIGKTSKKDSSSHVYLRFEEPVITSPSMIFKEIKVFLYRNR